MPVNFKREASERASERDARKGERERRKLRHECAGGERTGRRSSCRSSRKQRAYRAPLAELAKKPGIRRCFNRRRRKWICTSSMWRICCLSIRMRKRIQLLLISTTSFCCIICFLIFLFATFLPPPPLLYRSFLLALYLFFFSPCFSFRLICLLGCVSVVPPPNFLSPVLEFISQGCRRHTKVSQNRS